MGIINRNQEVLNQGTFEVNSSKRRVSKIRTEKTLEDDGGVDGANKTKALFTPPSA